MCTNCKMFSQMQIAIALRLQHINQKYDTLVHTRFFHFSFNKLACWWIILFLHLRLFAWSRIIILPVWIQGDDILIGGKHLSTFVGALSTLFTENVRLSRVIFKLCCHIFSSSLTHFITTYIYYATFETMVELLRRPLDNWQDLRRVGSLTAAAPRSSSGAP